MNWFTTSLFQKKSYRLKVWNISSNLSNTMTAKLFACNIMKQCFQKVSFCFMHNSWNFPSQERNFPNNFWQSTYLNGKANSYLLVFVHKIQLEWDYCAKSRNLFIIIEIFSMYVCLFVSLAFITFEGEDWITNFQKTIS